MKDEDVRNRFIELRAENRSYSRIANELKVSKQTLITWSKDLTHIIANLRAIEIEELQEKYFALREKRLELFGETIRKIQSELKTRDLTNVPTEKLHFLLLKYAEAVRKDSLETVFSTEELDWLGDLKQVSTWRA